jgi:iron complex outermembrane receptor protein
LHGERDFAAETLLAYELGYRLRPSCTLFFDLAGFYNDYSDLRATLFRLEPRPDAEVPHIELVVLDANLMEGTSYGGEFAVEWRFWGHRGRLRTAYAYLQTDFDLPPASDFISANAESVAPEHQFYVWSSFDLRSAMHFDAVGRFIDTLPTRTQRGVSTGISWKF